MREQRGYILLFITVLIILLQSSCVTFVPCSQEERFFLSKRRGEKVTAFIFTIPRSPLPNDHVRMIHCIAGKTYRGSKLYKKQNRKYGVKEDKKGRVR